MTVEKEQVPHFKERTVEKDGATLTLVRGAGSHDEYTQTRARIIEGGEESRKPKVVDIQVESIDKKGNHARVDEIVVRGRDMMITVKANAGGSREGDTTNYFSFFVGEDGYDATVLSPDRKLVQNMVTDLMKKITELGDEGEAFAWLRSDSPYASMKNPYDGFGLFSHGVPPSDMFKKKE